MAYSADSIYGVQLLDDLHNYFPELLYNSGRFQSVQEVLQYITSVTRRRFDLFTYGREIYNANLANAQRLHPTGVEPLAQPLAQPLSPTAPVPQATVQVTTQHAPPAHQSLLQPIVSTRPSPRTYASLFTQPMTQSTTQQVSTPPQQQSMTGLESLLQLLHPQPIITTSYTTTDEDATSWLMNLLGGGRGGLPASFLEPIPIFPTREQIQGASAIRTLDVSDGTNTCTICQDDMSVGNTIRTLNTCQHTFHISCIDMWFVSNVRCPICRHDIREIRGGATDQKNGEDAEDEFGDEDGI